MKIASGRHVFLKGLFIGIALMIPSLAVAGGKTITKKSYTYKKVGTLEIKADVYRADDDILRPVVIWIHGGALINGSRRGVSIRVKKAFLDAGYALVSIDYRLAPETKLPEIIADLEDAYTWVYKEGPKLFHGDTKRIAVLGGSAGGYLTLTAGFRAQPKPVALVAFWGYGDLVGPWYSEPSAHYRKRPLVPKERIINLAKGYAVADGNVNQQTRRDFYLYTRQNGVWPQLVSGFNPKTEAEKFNPYMPVKNVTKDYPPTLMIHGTSDTDVPYEQSVMMQKEFQQHGVPHRLISIPDAEHGLRDGDPKLINAAYEAVFPFVDERVRGK